ncbi:telomere stability and silencing-domain-containing protein [Lipomyces kononenkoae]|uniref:Telomere stability and silencing-domain-containing protein n=1 Tax=Lipomyces kononenkoae TaxID=34357 RepID=A0ACC3TB33_LIPKO
MASESAIDVFVSTFSGIKPLAIQSLSPTTPISGMLSLITELLPATVARNVYVTQQSGRLLPSNTAAPVSTLIASAPSSFIFLHITPRLCGGKGGFGSQLRAQGGRMSARRKRGSKNDEESKDNYRNLDGRRMRSIRQAKDLAIFLETAPQRIKEASRQKRERLKAILEMEDPASKARFNDVEFLEESEEMIEDLKRLVEDSVKLGGQRFVESSRENDEETSGDDDNDNDNDDNDNDNDNDDERGDRGEETEAIPKFVVGSADSRGSSSSSSSRKPKIASFFDEDVGSDASDSDDDNSTSNRPA